MNQRIPAGIVALALLIFCARPHGIAAEPPQQDITCVAWEHFNAAAKLAPALARPIVQELADQRANLKLIASENYCSLAIIVGFQRHCSLGSVGLL